MIRTITRRQYTGSQILSLFVTLGLLVTAVVSAVEIPNIFQAGETARADQVNANFQVLANEIESLEDQLADLAALSSFIRVETGEINGMAGPHVIIEGANLHVRSGSGFTYDDIDPDVPLTGLGNLVIGYNEVPTVGAFLDGDRAGSHNLVLGTGNRYTEYAGIVAGAENRITAPFASILGGRVNRATGEYASVAGGFGGLAQGNGSSVAGGMNNRAFGATSTVSGGQGGAAQGTASSISGGINRTVTNAFDWAACNVTCN